MCNNTDNNLEVKIDIMQEFDKKVVEEVTDIHMRTFPGFFLTFLGRGFLKQLYKGFCQHNNSGLVVATCDGKTAGFLAYSYDLSEFYKFLIKKKLIYFFWYSLCAFFRNPKILFRLFRAFLKPGESKKQEKYMEISSIGVLPEMKNMNIGSLLIEKTKEIYNSEEYEYIKLETDAEDNDGVNAFYKKNEFVLDNQYSTPEGRKMNEYHWSK